MPELPEVEIMRRGLEGRLRGMRLEGAAVRTAKLREPLPDIAGWVAGFALAGVRRRAKHLVFDFERDGCRRWLVGHMGMSGSWRLWPRRDLPEAGRHDHVDLVFEDAVARYTDPRRFGMLVASDVDPVAAGRFGAWGPEPWDPVLDGGGFHARLQATRAPVKQALLAGRAVAGCGNIYACESLFWAGIHPARPACRVTPGEAAALLAGLRQVLERAIAAGGSTLHDFRGVDGEAGWFAVQCAVYGREGGPCPRCGRPVERMAQSGRSSFFCPGCQR
ncbi:MAG: bifunctional DNA-formamidopyrimidine glycosylase/DNA-(apurinic or apyrimidinic site) lyase [Duodenibacillus sp.]|nr:bifunctional DNA-formamidopyrimidine glycosylase/DNA-(apurinic or apyrimidinic site) lyase [Duodenibacillus sp.]